MEDLIDERTRVPAVLDDRHILATYLDVTLSGEARGIPPEAPAVVILSLSKSLP